MPTTRMFLPHSTALVFAFVLPVLSLPQARGDEADLVTPPESTEPAAAQETGKEWTEEEIAEAISKLDSEDFAERELMQLRLWQAGAQAEKGLEEAAKTGSAEVRFRAARILERFRFGIYPDTPVEVVQMVQGFRRGDLGEKSEAISELARRGLYDVVQRLLATVEDEGQLEALGREAAKESEEGAGTLIAGGNLEGAANVLRLSAVTRKGMQNFATFCVLTGTAARERERIETSTWSEKRKQELRHWLARVEGDFAGALGWAEKLGDKALIRESKIAAGDLIEFASGAEDLRLRTLKSLGFKAALQRMKGEDEAFRTTIKEIVAYTVQHESEIEGIYVALLANGAVDEALEAAKRADPDIAFDHLIVQQRFAEAAAVKGLPGPVPPYDAWLAEQVKAFSAVNETDDGEAAQASLGEFREVAAYLYWRGEQEYLDRMSAEMAAAAAEKSGTTNVVMAKTLRGLRSRQASLTCAERALDKGIEFETVLGIFGGNSSLAEQWRTFLMGKRKLEPKAALRLIEAMLTPGGQTVMPPEVAKMIDDAKEIIGKAGPDGAEEVAAWRNTLAESFQLWRQTERAIDEWNALRQAGNGDHLLNRIATDHIARGEWGEAAAAFKSLLKADGTEKGQLFVYGLALARSGQQAEGEALMRQADLRFLGDTTNRSFLEKYLWGIGEVELAERQSRLILALEQPYSLQSARSVIRLASRLRYTDRADEAAAMTEREILHALKSGNDIEDRHQSVSISNLSALFSLKARAKVRAGDPAAAVALAERALEISPGDSALLEYLYPLLVEAGSKDAADALFDKVYAVSRKGVEMFPKYGQANNNHAWLLARCGKNLDEALRHAEKAVEIEPDASASVDTLAEVYLARGDFTKAAETSDKALELAPTDVQLREQNARFHQAAAGAGSVPAP